jgi:transcriptional regulator with PAS, ATPase and Fis domain
MESTQPHAWSDLLARPPHVADLPSRRKAAPPCTVLVWDPRGSRHPLIAHVLSECGARPRRLEGLAAVQQVERACGCHLAVVALSASPSPSDLSLQVVRTLKHKGFEVICYEDGAQSWPLGTQCQVLLAGSRWLLDSATTEFAQELRQTVAQLLRANVARRNAEGSIKALMRRLGVVGESQAMLAVFQTILRASPLSDLPILITGETGTGKELLACAIHQLDPKRRTGPFVALNCGAISPGLAEAELFGHRRGAFTGADRDRKGLIRSAENGVLFLDEIGELDHALQAKLLRVLQEKRVLGVGEDQEVPVSVRVIAATNRDLGELVRQGMFRADLFHRLNVLSIHLPPLRERVADVGPLIEHFVAKYRFLRPSGALAVAPDFVEALMQVELPGNARQLENLVREALVQKEDETALTLRDLPLAIWQQLSAREGCPSIPSTPADAEVDIQASALEPLRPDLPTSMLNVLDLNGWNLSRSLHHCERLLLEAALHKARGNQSQTARLLGITPRSVYNKIHKHQLPH